MRSALLIMLCCLNNNKTYGADFNITFAQTYGMEGVNVTFECFVLPKGTKPGQFHWRKGANQDNIYFVNYLHGKNEGKTGKFKNRSVAVKNEETAGIYKFILYDPVHSDIDTYWCQFHGEFIADTKLGHGSMYLAAPPQQLPVVYPDLSSTENPLGCSKFPCSRTLSLETKQSKQLCCHAFKSRPASTITWDGADAATVTSECDEDKACSVWSKVNVTIPQEVESKNVTCQVAIPSAIPGRHTTYNITIELHTKGPRAGPGLAFRDILVVVICTSSGCIIIILVIIYRRRKRHRNARKEGPYSYCSSGAAKENVNGTVDVILMPLESEENKP